MSAAMELLPANDQAEDPAPSGPEIPGGCAAEPRSVDIEELLQWALAQTGYLPFRGCSERELAFDHGYDAVPRRCSRAYRGSAPLLRRAVDDDAAAVLAAVHALDPQIRDVVRACAMQRMRPSWFEGVVPRLVQDGVKRHRKRHRPVPRMVWRPCSPEAICAIREIYSEWHRALAGLAAGLPSALKAWQINGFSAPAAPWQSGPAENT